MVKIKMYLAILAPIILALVPASLAQSDSLANCKPTGAETILCNDVEDICRDLSLSVIYDIDNYCSKGRVPFINPDYICNCDVLCIDELEEGDDCTVTYTSDYPEAMCGRGLACLPTTVDTSESYACQRDPEKACIARVIEYETAAANGVLSPGLLYPNCNNVGKYAAVQCSTSTTCYCADTDGNRLFGEAPYTEEGTMDCECALHWQKNEELGLTVGLRCLRNGNLDPLQCNEEFCFCYNSTRGAVTAGPFHPSQMKLLPCYNETYHTSNYTTICTEALQLFNQQIPETSDVITVGASKMPNCSHDGYYDSIQASEEDSSYYCADPMGSQIEDFQFEASVKPMATCNCARRRYVMKKAGLTSFLPECCSNGNFNEIQTRGIYSYCVDTNGDQTGDAVQFEDTGLLNCTPQC